jgi:hypothetical protein
MPRTPVQGQHGQSQPAKHDAQPPRFFHLEYCESSHSPLSHIPVLRGTYASLLQTTLCEAQQLFGYLIRRTARMLMAPNRSVGNQAVTKGSMPNTTPLCMNMLLKT